MRKFILLILVALTASIVAMAQISGGDELGAHNGYGRGCVMCHAPHSGSEGNGVTTADTYNGNVALWGQNLMPYYGQTFTFAATKYTAALPAAGSVSISDTNSIVLLCLSCHDGNFARVAMMQNTTAETLPIVGGHAPTLFGVTPGDTGGLTNDHRWAPRHGQLRRRLQLGLHRRRQHPQPIYMNGTASSAFLINNPSSFWKNGTYTACAAGGTGTCAHGE